MEQQGLGLVPMWDASISTAGGLIWYITTLTSLKLSETFLSQVHSSTYLCPDKTIEAWES